METKNVLLVFSKQIMYKPIIYKLITDHHIVFNVLEAKILPKQEGRLILQLEGEKKNLKKAIQYLETEQVTVEILADKIKKDADKCVHCGACTSVCGTGALHINRENMEVLFSPEKCVACGLCTMACPVKAMSEMSIDMNIGTD